MIFIDPRWCYMTAQVVGFLGPPTVLCILNALCCQQCSITFRVGGLIEVVVAIGDRDWVGEGHPLGWGWRIRWVLGRNKAGGKWRCR